MRASPAPCPVTSPEELTVATFALLVDQTKVFPDRVAPLASVAVAASCRVPPTVTMYQVSDHVAAVTDTAATGAVGEVIVTLAVSAFPPPVATARNVPAVEPAV